MTHGAPFPSSFHDQLFLVSGLSEGAGVFVGRARAEPCDEQLTLEGKLVHVSAEGHVLVQPFASLVRFFLLDATYTVHHVGEAHVSGEISNLLEGRESVVSPGSQPFLHRWFLATCRRPAALSEVAERGFQHPAYFFFEQFVVGAERFRRALYRSSQVSSVRELDKVSELEGNLLVEVGKVASRVAVKLNQLVGKEPELEKQLDAFYGDELDPRPAIGGFAYLVERLQFVKDFARRTGRVSIVREINVFLKDSFFGLNEVVMEHKNSLDTLMTEMFNQYGITFDEEAVGRPFVSHEHAGRPSPHPFPVGAS